MATLDLSGQGLERDDVAPKLAKLKTLMLQRKVIWDKIPLAKRKAWVQNAATKDPIMDIAYDVWKWLDNNFFGEGG